MNDSSHEVMASTTTPATASMPVARRNLPASGALSESTLRSWAFTNCRVASPTNTMAPTATAFSNSTRPCPVSNSAPRSRRKVCTAPVTTVTSRAGVEMRLKPRTACTRSSSPGPASTTRVSSARPPNHTAMANAWPMPMMTPTAARSPPVRVKPNVATANSGAASAGSWVDWSMQRSGRITTQTQPAVSSTRAMAAMPDALSRSVQASGLSDAPTDFPVTLAVRNTAVSTEPTSDTIHAVRKKRTVRMYSTPSGQAVAMSTSEPNSTASPMLVTRRARPRGPPLPPVLSSVPSPVLPGATVVATAPATVGSMVAVGSTVTAGSSVVTAATESEVMVNFTEN